MHLALANGCERSGSACSHVGTGRHCVTLLASPEASVFYYGKNVPYLVSATSAQALEKTPGAELQNG